PRVLAAERRRRGLGIARERRGDRRYRVLRSAQPEVQRHGAGPVFQALRRTGRPACVTHVRGRTMIPTHTRLRALVDSPVVSAWQAERPLRKVMDPVRFGALIAERLITFSDHWVTLNDATIGAIVSLAGEQRPGITVPSREEVMEAVERHPGADF